MKKWIWPGLLIVTLMLGAFAGAWWTEDLLEERYEDILSEKGKLQPNENFKKIQQAYEIISSNYVEQIKKEKLTEGAIKGMLAELKDPYSVYMDEETSKQFEQTLDSSFQGIGAEISAIDGKYVIVSPFKNSPAEKAGLKPGDAIIKIDHKNVTGLELYEVVSLIRGKKGTKVAVDIERKGVDHPLSYQVVRDEIPLETVHQRITEKNEKKLGYLQITSFSEQTANDFKNALAKLEEQQIEGLLIDVRGNPGGLLTSVQEILQHFVTKSKPYIKVEERTGKKNEFYSERVKRKEYPIAVLIDSGSASASEIFASAMKEVEEYPLIGEKTFGKGTVQKPVSMGDGSTIKLTFYKWLTPDGNWIHKKGVAPTMRISQPDYFQLQPLEISKTLKRDTNNKQVKLLQKMLMAAGFSPGRVDGYYSEQTEEAVKAFQHIQKIKETGKVNQKTANALQKVILKKSQMEENDHQLQAGYAWLVRQQ